MLSVRILFVIAALVLLTTITSSTSAQDTSSSIYGAATDSNGALVPGVKVTAVNETTGTQRDAVTNNEGAYTIPLLPPGKYTITAEIAGFATLRITGVTLPVSINAQVPIVLQPAQVRDSVSIQADSNTIDTSNATVAFSVTNTQVTGLPVMTTTVGRTPLSVLPFLVTGVTPTDAFGSLGAGTANRRGESMSINGNRTISISYNFEGGDNNDNERGGAGSTFPNPDALQEMTIITNNYQADTGRSSGGVVNAVAKSGTSSLHGNLRYYRIHDSLNARSFFDQAIPRNRLNTLGGQLGGPIVIPGIYHGKNRTHFFFDFEGTRSSVGASALLSVLSDLERAGNFSNLSAAQRPRDPRTGIAFPSGLVPTDRIDPLAKIYLDRFIPRANEGVRGYRQTFQTDRTNNQFLTRVDHRLGKSDMLYGTLFNTRSVTDGDAQALPLGTRTNSNSGATNFVVNETHTLSSSTVNQFVGALTRLTSSSIRTFGSGASGTSPQDLGFTGIHPQTNNFLAIPGVGLQSAGVVVAVNNQAVISAKTTWQLKDDLAHTVSNHTLKFGAEMRSFLFNSVLGNNNGQVTFTNNNTFGSRNGIADFLLGIPSAYSQLTGNTMYPRQRAYSAYAMDEWKAKPSLTINLGVRYEVVLPMTDKLDQISVFRPGQKSVKLPNAPVGVLFVGDPDPSLGQVPRAGYPADKNNIAPRLGLAYSPDFKKGFLHSLTGDRKTAIRLGWGLFYDQPWGVNVSRFQMVQPFAVTQTLTASQIANAGGAFANPFGSLPNLWPLDLSERQFTGTPALSVYNPNYRTAYTYQYNLSIQRELPGSLLLNLAYVGSNTFKADRERELNLGVVGPGADLSNLQSRRLYPALSSIGDHESTGRARYDSFQTTLTRRLSQGLSFGISYWLSKAMDNGSSPEGLGRRIDVGAAGSLGGYPDIWARSAFDSRHNLVVSYTYDLPLRFRTRVKAFFLNGWQIGGILQARSGSPQEILQGDETTLTGRTLVGNPDLIGPYRLLDPRQVRTFVVAGESVTGNFMFDPTAFGLVTVDDWTQARAGSLSRNVTIAPGIQSWAASIVKRTKIFESHEIELRADINNVLNHASFGFAEQFVDTPTFAQPLAASPGRIIQLSARYRF